MTDSTTDHDCWFCRKQDGPMVFDWEFDTYLHIDCLRKALEQHPDDPEANMMRYLLPEYEESWSDDVSEHDAGDTNAPF